MARIGMALAAGFLVTFAGTARADEPERPRISVNGTGKISAAPDIADINIGVVSQAKTAREALAANSEAMNTLHQVLKQRGVAAKDVQTSQISVSPRYSQPPPNMAPGATFSPQIVGYDVTNFVQVTVRDIAKLGALLDLLVQSGANQVNGIGFRVNEPEKLLDEARKRAMAEAKRKAELLAGEAGVVVGPPIRIAEEGWAMPQPSMGAAMMRADFAAAPAAPPPVAAGEQELNVTVRVDYELRPPK